ncbi:MULTISPECIES: putative motility protein [Niveibacterium]|uniref:Motility protein n=1 Tax=Niveibacterium microcysteis TaxID=2811415 RepID=A0ABX7M3U0_9RHOO|nr:MULTISPECIES: putative motility protein [Niveibacterium]QSI75571.1 putative motility protein [Niveibacterium microcysteis]
MDTAAIAATVSDQAMGTVKGAAQIAVLKKSMEMQGQSALQLVQALPQPPAAAPGQPGALVNTYA